ncbi:MAG TPA: sugar transferase [Chthoniobacteraceae bacterium]|jgi:exopolysaccharide biosynthesis polyprenyl glycosylphosphotransferase|nr:sugar transferase [Chthoniobacteraceae bacterium]
MNTNGILGKHWLHISVHFSLDCLLFYAAALAGILIRFGPHFSAVVDSYWPSMMVMAVVFSSTTYIFGLYSTHSSADGLAKRAGILAFCAIVAVGVFVVGTYIHSFRPLGRGAVGIIAGIGYAAALAHHIVLVYTMRSNRERVAYVISCRFDELETRLFRSFGTHHLELAGVIQHNGYTATSDVRVLGDCKDLVEIVRRERIHRVLCTGRGMRDNTLLKQFCELRYSGVSVMPLISLCEEVDQYVPLELLTSEWLLNASGEPHLLYIKKVKRLFDIVASLAGIILSSPFLLTAMLLVKLTSHGPVFYRQARSGRFGRVVRVTKLRTMRADAEREGGAVWSPENDPRVTTVGRFLRKYRIDEIPQFFHVLTGEMSFVGPRPERPEMIDKLAASIPYYQERLMVQPGITGWAQVNYPYGSSAEDARRKLEYDLYYMKNMSVFLDLFILLDTVRIVLSGGVKSRHTHTAERNKALQDYQLSTASPDLPAARQVPDFEWTSV